MCAKIFPLRAALLILLIPIFSQCIKAQSESPIDRVNVLLDSARVFANELKANELLGLSEQIKSTLESRGELDTKRYAACLYYIGLSKSVQRKPAEALPVLEKALTLQKGLYMDNPYEYGGTFIEIGNCYYVFANFEKAYENFNAALEAYSVTRESYLKQVSTCLNNIAICYDKFGNYNAAIEKYNEALIIREKIYPENDNNIAACYINLGVSYSSKGEQEKAIYYAEKGISMRIKKYGELHPSLFMPYNNLGSFYSKNFDYKKAKYFLEKSIEIAEKNFGSKTFHLVYANINLGQLYNSIGENDLSMHHARIALNIGRSALGEKHDMVAMAYANIGNLFSNKGNLDSAVYYLNQALAIQKELFGDQSPNLSRAYGSKGLVYAKNGLYEESLKYYTLGLNVLGYQSPFKYQNVQDQPVLGELLSVIGNLLKDKYNSSNNPNDLIEAQYFHSQALDLLHYQAKYGSPATKLNLAQQASPIHFSAVKTNLKLGQITDSLHYLHEAFSFAERSKAFLLYEALQESKALQFAGIPDSLLQQEYDLRIDIAYYDKKRQERFSSGVAATDSLLLAFNNKIFDLNRRYESLKQLLESQFPQYYKAKYDLSTVSVQEVRQKLLQPGQSLLEFMVGDSNIYLFLLRPDTFLIHDIKHDFPLDQWVKDLTQDGIYGYYALPKDHPERTPARQKQCDDNYTRAARQLYDKLLAPVEKHLTEQVVIIPDGVLGYVPFEALLHSDPPRPGAFGSYPASYWLNKHQISYCYSATLLREMKERSISPESSGLLAMAPFFLGDTSKLLEALDTTELLAGNLRDALDPLEFSGKEVAVLAKPWGAKPLYGKNATVQ